MASRRAWRKDDYRTVLIEHEDGTNHEVLWLTTFVPSRGEELTCAAPDCGQPGRVVGTLPARPPSE